MNFDLKFYVAVFLRRLHIFVIVTALVSAAAIATAVLLPRAYSASALLMVESAEIADPVKNPNAQTADLEKLQTMENRLMTRANLIDIAKRLNVFRDLPKMTPDEIVQAMRENTTIKKSAKKGEATTMQITFLAETAKNSAGVVNEYVTLILKDDVDSRTQQTESAREFFDQQVRDLSADLDNINAKILDFQNKNSDALPSTLGFRMTQLAGLQGKFDTAEATIQSLTDQRARLVAIFESTGQVTSGGAQTPEAKQLASLQDQLTQTLAVLAPTHPKVKLLEAQIAQLESIVKTQAQSASTAAGPGASMFDVQVADIDGQIKAASQTRDQLKEQMAKLQESIDRTPANQIALDALNRDYANTQQQYDNAVARQGQAASAEKIAVLSKGEKVSVLDAATVPDSPAKPKRALIALGGIFSGMLLGAGSIGAMEALNRSVRRPADIANAFGITPIVTIPYLRTPNETMKRRSVFIGMMMVALLGIPLALYAVHVMYQPLDILLARVARLFGIDL